MATYFVRTDGSDSNTGLANDSAHAWLTVAKALATVANGDLAYIVGTAVYSLGTGLTASVGAGSVTYTAKTRLIGCTATPGDGGKATIRATAGINLLTISGNGWSFESLDFDGNNVASSLGVSVTGNYNALVDCKIRNFKNAAIDNSGGGGNYCEIQRCEITGCSSVSAIRVGSVSTRIYDSWIHDNTVTAIDTTFTAAGSMPGAVINCLITNNTGATSDGISITYSTLIRNCIIHGNGRHGILLSNNYIGIQSSIQNNIITSNGGYGIKFSSAPVTTISQQIDYNAYYNNSGPVNNLSQSTHDVTLTADPYTLAASNDFSLNTTSGGGAACRAAGFPGLFPGGLTTGKLDIGAAQHADPAGGRPGATSMILTQGVLCG